MNAVDKVNLLIENARAKPYQFDPTEFVVQVGNLLESATKNQTVSELNQLVTDVDQPIQGAYFHATDLLYEFGFVAACSQLLLRWWNELGERHLSEQTHIYRAHTGYKLGQLYLRIQDHGTAIRWLLLTHADDRLSGHHIGGAGIQWLRTIFGVSEAEVKAFNQIAEENLCAIEAANVRPWKLFAEDVITRLMLEDVRFERLFSWPTGVPELNLSPAYFKALLERVKVSRALKGPASNKEKGDALESLAIYLFTLIPGWCVTRNVHADDEAFESDIIVNDRSRVTGLSTDLLGRSFLVECKNRKDNIGVSEVGYFLHRMHLTHCTFGVMFSPEGITGKTDEETAARTLIRRTYHEDGTTCIVVDMNDLEDLAEGEITFWTLL